MSLNPAGTTNYSWNYSNQNREGYALELTGTIVSLQEVQAREYNPNSQQPGRPSFWPDGNPKMNIRVGLATPDGQLKSITFMKAGKKQVTGEKPSLHMQLFNLTPGNMMDLIGMTIHIWTWPAHPNTNQPWGQGNPRLFGVEVIPDVKYELAGALPPEFTVPELYADSAVQGGQPQAPAPAQMVPPQPQPYYAPQAQPQYQPVPQPAPQPMPQPQYQPAPQVPQYQPVAAPMQQPMPAPQPMTAPMPQGMDPAVAQAMQQVGATNVQPVVPEVGSVYDQDIPF